MSYAKIALEHFQDGDCARLVLRAPPGNILDGAMMAELGDALDALAREPGLKLVAFVGEGKHFSFGASVEEHVGEKARGMLRAFHGLFERLAALAVPTAAVVRGRCLGGGMELAAFCNFVFAHPGASFAQPEIQLGVLAPVASLFLPLRLGQGRADDACLTGRSIGAAEALTMGLVDHVAEDPMAALEEWARRELAPKSAAALRLANRASRWRWNRLVREELPALERFYLEELMATRDASEGLAAFMEKRPPVWQHR